MGFCKHSIFAVIIFLYSHISHNLHDDSVEFSTISLKLLQWNWVVTKFRLPMVTLPNYKVLKETAAVYIKEN